jgi:hypothetical protein
MWEPFRVVLGCRVKDLGEPLVAELAIGPAIDGFGNAMPTVSPIYL